MRNNDIADTRRKIALYARGGLVSLGDKSAIPQIGGDGI
jgi:argininosuccinate synthase